MDQVSPQQDVAVCNQSEGILRTIIESFPGGMTAYDGQLNLLLANDNFYLIYDLDRDEFPVGTHYSKIGRRLAERGHYGEGDADEIVAQRISDLKNFKPYSSERHCPDGRTLEVRGFSMLGGGLVTTVVDITEIKRQRLELIQSNKRIRDMAEVSSDWFWETDHSLKFTYISDRFTEIMGIPAGNILGRTRHEIGKESDFEWDTHLEDLEARREIKNFCYCVLDAEGRHRHVSISGVPFFNEDGEFRGYRGTGRDKTAEVEANAKIQSQRDSLRVVNSALSDERKRLVDIYHNTPVMMHSIRRDGEIIDVSDYWCHKMGYAADEVIGQSIYKFMDAQSAALMQEKYAPKLFSDGAVDNVHYVYVRKDGSKMDVRLSATTCPSIDGKGLQTFSVAFDISEELRAKQELSEQPDHPREMAQTAV